MRKKRNLFSFLFSSFILSSAFSCVTMVGIFGEDPFSVEAIVATIMIFLWSMTQYLGPFVVSVHWVNCNVLHLCGSSLKFWRLSFSRRDDKDRAHKKWATSSKEETNAAHEFSISQNLDWGFKLLQDLKDVNQDMGNLILIDIMTSMSSITISSLFMSSVYTPFISE